jgi:hypothetical protein
MVEMKLCNNIIAKFRVPEIGYGQPTYNKGTFKRWGKGNVQRSQRGWSEVSQFLNLDSTDEEEKEEEEQQNKFMTEYYIIVSSFNKMAKLDGKPHFCCNLSNAINPLNPELNPICYLLALLGAHYFLHVSRIRVKSLTLRRLMSYKFNIHGTVHRSMTSGNNQRDAA